MEIMFKFNNYPKKLGKKFAQYILEAYNKKRRSCWTRCKEIYKLFIRLKRGKAQTNKKYMKKQKEKKAKF